MSARGGLQRSSIQYDNRMFGILQDDPLIVLRTQDNGGTQRPIVRNGDAVVNVTDLNGPIHPGDYITSSPIPGKGMQANESGYTIGIATSEVTPISTTTFEGRQLTVGQVNVGLRIEYAELSTARSANRLFETLNAAFFRNAEDPEKFTVVVRYVIAGIVALVFFLISFFGFTRSITRGVEAIGRNPLARHSIQVSILIHLGLTIAVSLIGLVIVFLIIRV